MTRPDGRWLDAHGGAPEGARSLLRAAGAPDAAARDRMWAELARATGAGAAAGAAAGHGVARVAGVAVPAKAVVSLALVAVAGAALSRGAAPAPAAPARAAHVATVAPAVPRAPAPPVAPTPAPRTTEAPRSVEAVPAPPRAARSPVARRAVAAAVPAATTAAEAPFTLDDEVAALAGARARLRDDPAGALASLEALRGRLRGGGVLAYERERFAVEALHRVGRDGEALARAEAFLAAHPASATAARVRAIRDAIVGARTIP